MSEVVIVSRSRTPIGSFQGALKDVKSTELGSIAIKSAIERAGVGAIEIDEVVMGQVLQAGVGQAPARQASLGAGVPVSVPCTTVNKVCGSGLKAIMLGAQSIRIKEANIVVAGGMESMSNAPYLLPTARQGFRMGNQTAVDAMIHDGLWDPYGHAHMGTYGDMCANQLHFSREAQDAFAKSSYERALVAWKEGYFASEIAAVEITGKQSIMISQDEEPFRYLPEKMPTLKPAFGKEGTVTAANASKVSDGAAAVVLMDAERAKEKGLKPLAKIVASATFAHDPAWFTTAPAGAIQKVLTLANLSVKDIDLFEINEAFANVTMATMNELGIPHEKVNVWGGAIALGHPIGCSGARLIVTLLSAMQQRGVKYGCVSICLGGGEAVAMIVERTA